MTVREAALWMPLLMKHYDPIVQMLETPKTRNARKFPRKEALDLFIETRSLTAVAVRFGVSVSAVDALVKRAFRLARAMEGATRWDMREM